MAMGVGLALIYDDLNARNLAQELLPAVRVAARLASAKADLSRATCLSYPRVPAR